MTLIPRPDKYPEWASEDHTDPIVPVPNVVEPGDSKKKQGWFYKEYPPANWFNWLLRYIYRWIKFFDDQNINLSPIFGIDTSLTPNVITVTLDPPVTSYIQGKLYIIKVSNTITGAATISLNGLPPKPIVDLDKGVLVGGEMLANGIYLLTYSFNDDKFILQTKPDAASGWITGEMKPSTRIDNQPGFIKYAADGTIGNTGSGATIYQGPEAYELYILWWSLYPTVCPVDGGRGASAIADWNAGKRLHVFPHYNRAIVAAGVNGTPGWMEGERAHSITENETKRHSHLGPGEIGASARNNGGQFVKHWLEDIGQGIYSTASYGGSTAMSLMQPSMYINFYVKL